MARGSTPVTEAELAAIAERIEDLSVDLRDLEDRIRKHIGMADDVKTPIRYARVLQGLASKASDVSRMILVALSHEEDRRLIKERHSNPAGDL